MKKRVLAMLMACTLLVSTGCSVNVAMDENGRISLDGVPVAALEEDPGDIIEQLGELADKTAPETEGEAGKGPVTGGGKPWVNSDIKENVTADMPVDPRDDFHLYVNKEWILDHDIPAGDSAWTHGRERMREVKNQCLGLLKDESLTGHDAELIQTYYSLLLDWEARNRSGVTEIKDLYDAIMAVSGIEDMTGLLTDTEASGKLYQFFIYGADTGLDDPGTYLVCISEPPVLLNDSSEYGNRTEYGDMYYGCKKETFTYIAGKMGMDQEEAAKRFDSALELESKLAERIYTAAEKNSDDFDEKINNEMSFEELVSLTEAFPLEAILSEAGYKYDGSYFVRCPDYFEILDAVYSDENLEGIRNLILVNYLLDYKELLDRETYEKSKEIYNSWFGTSGIVADDEMAYKSINELLPASLQKVYISKYGSEEEKKNMEDLCRISIDAYGEMLSANTWASDEVRDYAIEKLDKIAIHALYPDKFRDTSNIDISGCSLIEANENIMKAEEEYGRSLIGTKKDKEMWADNLNILECNAFYQPSENSINMVIGMMGEPYYNPDIST